MTNIHEVLEQEQINFIQMLQFSEIDYVTLHYL